MYLFGIDYLLGRPMIDDRLRLWVDGQALDGKHGRWAVYGVNELA